MKKIRITLLVVFLAVLVTLGVGAQAARASQQLAINQPSIGLQQATTPVITVNVTAQINNPAQPAPSSSGSNNTGLILIVIVVVLVLIILVGILISSRRPTDV